MSSPSRGSPANYRHPSEGPRRCSSVAVAIITAPLQTSVLWTSSPSGLSLSHRALLCQARPLTSHLSPGGDNWFALSSGEEGRSRSQSVCKGSFGQKEKKHLVCLEHVQQCFYCKSVFSLPRLVFPLSSLFTVPYSI